MYTSLVNSQRSTNKKTPNDSATMTSLAEMIGDQNNVGPSFGYAKSNVGMNMASGPLRISRIGRS